MKPDILPPDPIDLLRDRCLTYLLGEMTEQQAAKFESELDEPTVSDALLRESELLCGVAMSDSLGTALAGSAAKEPVRSAHPAERLHAFHATRSLTAVLATLAASALIFATYRLADQPNSNATRMQAAASPAATSFELELAKTWVDPAIDWDLDDQEDFTVLANDEHIGETDDSAPDDTFEWMVAAVEASYQQGDDSNDG